jgi:tetratricopeptide (TPR) repeat protein
MGNLEQAVKAFNKAIEYNEKADYKISVAPIHFSLGLVLIKLGKSEQATEHLRKAAEELQKKLTENPTYHEGWRSLGDIFATMGDFKAAAEAFKKALALNPTKSDYCGSLARALEYDGRYDEAIEVLKKFIEMMKQYKQDEAVNQLQKYLESLEYKNSKSKPR